MKGTLVFAMVLLASDTVLRAAAISQWNFNSLLPDGDASTGNLGPSLGAGTASLGGGITGAFSAGDGKHDPAGSADNSAWNTSKYPAPAVGSKSAGVHFDVDTTGYQNIIVSWSQQNSSTASRYLRFQYTLDSYQYIDFKVIAVTADGVFTNQSVDLSGIGGAADNPSFGFKLLTEFEDTATGTGAEAYVATKDGSNYGTAGTIRFDMMTVSGSPLGTGDTPPYIFGSLPAQTLRLGQLGPSFPFTILDAESPASSLTLSATSSELSVVPLGNIVFDGMGADRSVAVTAGIEPGVSLVTVWVSDPAGKSNSTSFVVTVLAANTAPYISSLSRTNTTVGIPTAALAFIVGDAETPAAQLVVSGVSANTVLLPNSGIVFGGSGSNRTVTLVPAPGQAGVAPITITVNDGTNTASTSFALMVTPSAEVVFFEPFAYGDGALVTGSAGLWGTRSGTAGECQVTNGELQVSSAQTEDVAGPLVGGPYATGNHTVLYASFRLDFLNVPKEVPGLFAHFANGSTLRGRVYAGLTNAAPGCVRLFVANGSDACTTLPADLQTNAWYTVVTRYDIDAASTTLWLNPASELAPGAVATDAQTATRIASYGFRQDSDLGAVMLIDDLKVGLSFASVTSSVPAPPLLGIERDGQNIVLRWADSSCALQRGPTSLGPFINVPGAASPFTNAASGHGGFFRLSR